MGKLEFIQPGLYSSLQDQGRNIGRNWGIPEGGAMDRLSAKHANLIFNNALDAPVLEITQMGPTFLCHTDGQLAVAGAKIPIFKNKENLENPSLIDFQKGDILKFGNATEGVRSYLSIKNGFKTDLLFNSVSPIAGVSSDMRFKKGDLLYFESSTSISITNARIRKPLLFQEPTIRTIPGPEHHLLSADQKEILKNTSFKILPNATRMAYPLTPKNDSLKHTFSLLTSPVVPGVVQLTPAGQLIVLMRDAQTTGGYPRVLVVTEAGLNQLGQLGGGKEISFLI